MPNKLKKCTSCNTYTLKEICENPSCKNNKTKSAHYKFIKIRNAPKDSAKHFEKIRNKKKNS